MLDKKLLEILVCPQCKGEIEYSYKEGKEDLICQSCKLIYTVEDGIPVMLIDQAKKF